MKKVYLLNSKRTAIGKFLGSFYEADAVAISAQVLQDVFAEKNYSMEDVDSVIVGNVISAGLGQGAARNIAISAGVSQTVPAYAVNMVCGSGMKAVLNGINEIRCGDSNLVVSGGLEFMSNIPFATDSYIRLGKKFGDFNMMDLMTHDGLIDAFSGVHMGITAENIAHELNITREAQDDYAYLTQQRAIKAVDSGEFISEITPITLKDWKKREYVFKEDEYINRASTREKLATLKPTFLKNEDGTVTAGNTSGINDGAAFCLLASEEYIAEHHIIPEFEIVDGVSIGCDPQLMGLGPYYAIKRLLQKTKLDFNAIDCFEINEAFAAQVLGTYKMIGHEYGISVEEIIEKSNLLGSGIGLGHPLGATGARLITTISHLMHRKNYKYGIASLCIGGGQGTAVLLRKVEQDEFA